MHMNNKRFGLAVLMISCLSFAMAGVGCAGRAELIPNKNPALRKTAAEFAADAAKRFPYKSGAPRGGNAQARAQVGYTLNVVEIVNLSGNDLADVEIWINSTHVVYVPLLKPNQLQKIPFQAIYDDNGKSFPTDNSKTLVNKVEIYTGEKMWDVPKQMAD